MLKPVTKFALKQTPGDFRGLVPVVYPRMAGLPPAYLPATSSSCNISAGQTQGRAVPGRCPIPNGWSKDGVARAGPGAPGREPHLCALRSRPDEHAGRRRRAAPPGRRYSGPARPFATEDGPVIFDVTLNGLNRAPSLLKLSCSSRRSWARPSARLAAPLMALHALAASARCAPAAIALGKGRWPTIPPP